MRLLKLSQFTLNEPNLSTTFTVTNRNHKNNVNLATVKAFTNSKIGTGNILIISFTLAVIKLPECVPEQNHKHNT